MSHVSSASTVSTTLARVAAAPRRLDQYRGIVDDGLLDELRTLAETVAGARVLQVNATAFGGGVAELLATHVGLLCDLGVAAEWHVVCPDADFFRVTKQLHNAMQGRPGDLGAEAVAIYEAQNEHCAAMLGAGWDIIVVHDPQPAAMIATAREAAPHWVWRCHIDTSSADASAWTMLRPFVAAYDRAVFTLESFVPADLRRGEAVVMSPVIDPLSTKNAPLSRWMAREIIVRLGIDPTRPLIVQVSRFDPWKDPLGVVDAWRLARAEIPGLQLALVGSMADDDPEGWQVYDEVRSAVAGDLDCHLLTNLNGVGPVEVNALQREADVVIQKSLREGFGLTVSEALWKRTPVIGGDAGGIPLQLDAAGSIVRSVPGCAQEITRLLADPVRLEELGARGHDHVRRHFLAPRLVRDELQMYATLLSTTAQTAPARFAHGSPQPTHRGRP